MVSATLRSQRTSASGWKLALSLLGAVIATVLVVSSPIWATRHALRYLRGKMPHEGETWPYQLARILGPRSSSEGEGQSPCFLLTWAD